MEQESENNSESFISNSSEEGGEAPVAFLDRENDELEM